MQPIGRTVQPFTDQQLAVVTDYLTTDKSYRETAAEHNVPVATLKYWVAKYKKLKEAGKL